ncbi:MAG: hypothetical protein Fur009_6380 [Candidatus Microgenomates bacterium]
MIILVFIIGVRYGQKVEKANKAIDYFLSITPTKKPTPTPTWIIVEYRTKSGFKINYPSFLKIKEGSKAGEISLDIDK